jgi:flagellar basal body-associated protein FliL
MDKKAPPPGNLKNNIREDVSKHFQRKKDAPIKKKRSSALLYLIIILLVLGVLFTFSFFLYSLLGGSVEKETADVEETENKQEISDDDYLNQDEDDDGLTTNQEMELGT